MNMFKNLNNRNIFLFDGIGAAVSNAFTALILPLYSELIGLSANFLYSLAILPFVFMMYSFCIYFLAQEIKSLMLSGIIVANLMYCLISVSVIAFHNGITVWGKYLLLIEIVIVLVVVIIELKVYKKSFLHSKF